MQREQVSNVCGKQVTIEFSVEAGVILDWGVLCARVREVIGPHVAGGVGSGRDTVSGILPLTSGAGADPKPMSLCVSWVAHLPWHDPRNNEWSVVPTAQGLEPLRETL